MMQERITNKRKQVVFLLVLCLSLVFGCTKKQEAVKEPEINPEDYLKVSFTEIVDNYFFKDDIDGLQQCIGKIVTSEETGNLYENYGRRSYFISYDSMNFPYIIFIAPRINITAAKTMIYTTSRINKPDGNNDTKIVDIAHMEGAVGNSFSNFELRKDSPNGGFFTVKNYIGVVERKANTEKFPIPLGKKIIPDWIVSVNEEGKIIITKPVDDTMFFYIPDEPE